MQRSPTKKDGKYSSQPDLACSNKIDLEPFVPGRKRKERSEFEDLRNEIHILITTIKSDQESKFDKITKSIEELKVQNNILKNQNEKIISCNEKIENKLIQTTELYSELRKSLELLQDDHIKATNKVTALEEQIEEMQRSQRSSFIEITTPITDNENVHEIVTKIHEAIGVKTVGESIRQCYRIKQGAKKPVIVEYKNGQIRNEVLKLAKSYNKKNNEKMSTKVFGNHSTDEPIYINEFLTPNAKRLFYHTRQLRKSYGFKYNWISAGRIFVKKNDGDPAILIKSLEQVERIKVEGTM